MTPAANRITPDTSALKRSCRILRLQDTAVAVTTESGVLLGEVTFEQILCGPETDS